jgi:hypothetical protein
MEFTVGRPDVIRAISQRWLLNFWKDHLGAQRVPPWQRVVAEKLSGLSRNLSFLNVDRTGEDQRFLVRFNGALIAEVYGSTDCRGRHLDEIMPPERHQEGLAPYRRSVHDGAPVYTIHDLTDRNGRLVHFERLLLPFARDGETVDRILASFEFVCLDGAFDGHDLMRTQTAPPALRMAATIDLAREAPGAAHAAGATARR